MGIFLKLDKIDSDSSDKNGYEASFRLARSFLVRPSMQFRE